MPLKALAPVACNISPASSIWWVSTIQISLYCLGPISMMVVDHPVEVVSLIVSFLVNYSDFRQLLWLCREGRSMLSQVQTLVVDGNYTSLGARGDPFDYIHFPALVRLTITIRFCLYHVYRNFTQFSRVGYLTMLFPGVIAVQFDNLMLWLRCYLNVEIRHVSIHVSQRNMLLALPFYGFCARGVHMLNLEQLAEHVLMLSTHDTLHSFDLSIAGDHFSILWATEDEICLGVWNDRMGLSSMWAQRLPTIDVHSSETT